MSCRNKFLAGFEPTTSEIPYGIGSGRRANYNDRYRCLLRLRHQRKDIPIKRARYVDRIVGIARPLPRREIRLVLHIGYIIGTYRLVDEALKSRIVVISAVVRIGDRVNSRAG
ncbi:MAG TPA: hypothetical protein VHV29_12205 [Terriglobales bacterium]|nr:hypothetical protein [Terriglobales bacterium]